MRLSLRRQVRQRDRFRCAYCGISEEEIGAELTIDHFRPVRHGGSHALENLVYACHACNEFKGHFWSAEVAGRLLHPGQDEIAHHIQEGDDGNLLGLTERGRLHSVWHGLKQHLVFSQANRNSVSHRVILRARGIISPCT